MLLSGSGTETVPTERALSSKSMRKINLKLRRVSIAHLMNSYFN